MFNNDHGVASVDISRYIDGLGKWVEMYVKDGYEPYLIRFMFRLPSLHILDSRQQIKSEVKKNRENRPLGILRSCASNYTPRHSGSRFLG